MKRLPAPLTRLTGSLSGRIRSATPRERTLLAALSAVAVLLLLSAGIRLTRSELALRRELAERVESGERILASASATEPALNEKTARLAAKRRTASDMLAAIDSLARESGLNAEAANPRPERAGKLTIHRVRLSLRAPSLQKLMDFDDRLRLRGDGLVVERVTVESRTNGVELSAVYEIASCQASEAEETKPKA